ncbi:MAG: dihydrolipoyl dehydrogenase [Candidatus Aegiribacteria sp.]
MCREVDVAIIGAGTAGLSALSQVKKRTDSFVIINDGPYGTTCARVGCMPSKALIEAADAYHGRHLYGEMGLRLVGSVEVDGKAVMERVRRLRDMFVARVKRSTDGLDEGKNIPGRAKILAPDLIEVNGDRIRTKRLIIATGSTPVVPGPWRELGDRLLTSDSLFEMDDLPESLAVVGLGAIGLEIAQAMSRLGVEVTGFDALERIGGITDPEVAETAAEIIGSEFPIHTGAKVDLAGNGAEGGVKVSWNGNSATVDKVLASVGRKPNIQGLGLENLGVELDDNGLPAFDEHTLQVGDLPVFLPGDVNARAPILHEAADDGHIAGYNAMQKDGEVHCFHRRTPIGIVFSHPNIAYAGLKRDQLNEDDAVTVGQDYESQGRAMTAGVNHGLLRVYASKSTARLLGAEMVVPSGEHVAHLLSWAIQRELTVFQILELPFYHPVIEEGVRSAVRRLAGRIEKKEPAPEVPLCRELPDRSLE